MNNEIMKYSKQTFESIKYMNKLACKNSGYPVEEHFADARKMITLSHGAV